MIGRPADTAAAAFATLAATVSLTTLVQLQTWVGTAVFLVVLMAGIGFGLRQARSREVLVVGGQLLGVAVAITWIYAPDTTWFGIPTVATAESIGTLLRDFGATVYAASAPLPLTPGVSLVLPLAAALVAILVDDIAVTRGAPAAAGIALLAVFLTSAANSGSSLSPLYFCLAALAWLMLLARQSRGSIRRWSTSVASAATPTRDSDVDRSAALGFGSASRRLAVTGLALALLVPAVAPHLPTRFLLDGLARSAEGTGNAKVGFSSTLDVSRSLEDGDRSRMFGYTTTAPTASPLRVLATSSYDGTSWNRPGPSLGRAARLDLSQQVQRVERVVSVEDNTLGAPALAAPQPVVAADLEGIQWSVDETTSDIYVQARPDSYSITYLEPTLTPALLRDGLDGRPGADPLPNNRALNLSLRVDPRSESRVRAAAQEAAGSATTPYDTAMAIQEWLRSDLRFTYSLTLPAAPGSPPLDPISQFLETRTGYCVQFATAMIMMSRAKGIPARMAIGFLPGAQQQGGEYLVTADDAHAWPELYFPGAGWVRFEPTPSVRTGSAPSWTLPETAPATPEAPSAAGGDSTDPAQRDLDRALDSGADGTVTDVEQPLLDRVWLWLNDARHLVLLGAVLGLLAGLVLPATAYLLRRRRAARGPAVDRVEAQWQAMTARLDDIGLSGPAGGTLRDWERHYRSAACLDDDARAALGQVVATVETARYARPGTALADDVSTQVRAVTRAAARTRSRRERLHAFLLPSEAVRWWRRLGANVSQRAAAVWARVAEPLPGRRRSG